MIVRALLLLAILGALALIFIPLSGCATQERYITAEQDAEFRANCEPHGCTVVPNPVWQRIEQLLRSLGVDLGA